MRFYLNKSVLVFCGIFLVTIFLAGCETFTASSEPVDGSVVGNSMLARADEIISAGDIQKRHVGGCSYFIPNNMEKIFIKPVYLIDEDPEATLKNFQKSSRYFEGRIVSRRFTGVEKIGNIVVLGISYSIGNNVRPATAVVFPKAKRMVLFLSVGTNVDSTKIPAIVAAKTFNGEEIAEN